MKRVNMSFLVAGALLLIVMLSVRAEHAAPLQVDAVVCNV